MKAIILARVSTKDQEEGLSIPSQVRRLVEYTEKKNLQVEHTYEITESSSKETRKQFDQIVAFIKKAKEPIALVTDTVDRLQRSFRETPILDDMRRQGKIELHFLREGLIVNKDSNSAQMIQWGMGVLMASSYVLQLSDNVKRSKEHSIQNGEWVSKAPLGYRNITLPSGKKAIEVDPCNAPFITRMFELYAAGNRSFQTIAHEANAWGMKNARGNSILPSTIEFVLKNHFYYGKMLVKGTLYPHKYPSLIPEWLFKQVQDVMAGHHKSPVQYAGKSLLFRGLIKCASCGCTITGDVKKGKYTYYSCSNAKGVCIKHWIPEAKLLTPLLKNFEDIQLSDEKIEEIVAYLKQSFASEQAFFKNSQQVLRKELDQVQGRISKLVDMHLDGAIDSETYKLKLGEYKQRQREITDEIRDPVDADESTIITVKTVLDLAKRATEIYTSSNVDEKREFLRFVHSNLLLDDGNLHWELREPFSTFVKLGDQPGWLGRVDSNHYNWIQNPGSCH